MSDLQKLIALPIPEFSDFAFQTILTDEEMRRGTQNLTIQWNALDYVNLATW